MSAPDERPPGLPVNRIEALSDGVFAIAMTLLVLELRVPDVASGGALATALVAMWPKFVSFGLGFVLLGSLWIGQHYQFHYVRRTDRALLWLHLALLLVCSLVPFAVALLGRYWATPVVTASYGALLLASGGCLLASWTYATRGHRLVASSLPVASIVVYAVMPLLYLVPSRIDRHVAAASS